MGCDGGTIPRRDELVRVKKKPEQKDKDAELAFKWRHCTIKQLPLQQPIVACGLGKLYSKDAVIEGLLDRSILPESAVHIKNLKDVKNLTLTPNPVYDETKMAKGDCYVDGGRSPYVCPIIGLEMNGNYKFCFLWTCGCVMSERALKHVKSTICHSCQTPYEPMDVVILNADGDDLIRMEENMASRRKKKNGKKRTATEEENGKGVKNDSLKKKCKKEERASSSNEVFTSVDTRNETEDPAFRKAKENYSVAKDPNASEVLKSIFTTHKSADEQTRAHWITYNPFYN